MRETGPIRADFFGDTGVAKAHLGQARTLLGILKNRMAVGGLLQLVRTYDLEDGTRISVRSAFGQDSVVITSPPQRIYTPHGKTEKEVLPEDIPAPYMWIGVRLRWEDYPDFIGAIPHAAMPWVGLNVLVLEPGDNGAVMTDATVGWDAWLSGNSTTKTVDLAAAQATFSANFPESPATMHNFRFKDTDSGNQFMFTKNGLRLYDTVANTLDSDTFQPYDPTLADDKQAGDRFFLSAKDNYYDTAKKLAWDQVIVLDPYEQQKVAPCDGRDPTNWARLLLENSGMAAGMNTILPGAYILKIAANGSALLGSNRANKTSPNTGGHYGPSDFREYLTENNLPMRVEVEVRLGKNPYVTTQTFTIEVPDYDDEARTTIPFGQLNPDAPCAFEGGTNPHAANWWQGAILIDPIGKSVGRREYYAPGCFVPESYDFDVLLRSRLPVDIYCFSMTGAYPKTMAESIAYYLDIFLDDMCTGIFGDYEIVRRTYSDILSAAGGCATNKIYLYDIASNTFLETGDYEALPGADFDAAWNPLRLASRAICHGALWFDTRGDTGIGEVLPGDPDYGPCCPG